MGRRTSIYLTNDIQARWAALGEPPLGDLLAEAVAAREHERSAPPVTREAGCKCTPGGTLLHIAGDCPVHGDDADAPPLPAFADPLPAGRSLSAGEQQAAMDEALAQRMEAQASAVADQARQFRAFEPEPCKHPKSARDPKNLSRCRCGALNLPEPKP